MLLLSVLNELKLKSRYIEPLPEDHPTKFEFVNELIGNAIPPQYIAACEKGFAEAIEKGQLLGHPVWGARVVLQDGQSHPVDSSELAFRIACVNAFRVGLFPLFSSPFPLFFYLFIFFCRVLSLSLFGML